MNSTCPVCASTASRSIFSFKDIPIICNQLYESREEALEAPAGDVDLLVCTECAFVWNGLFEPAKMEYAPGYENALHFSPSFQTFADELAQHLVSTYNLTGKHIVEIGCGDGHMLDLMSKHGVASATGYDPSMRGKPSEFTNRDGVSIVPEYFTSQNLNQQFDTVMCRHVLEHLDTPVDLLKDIRRAIGDSDIPIYFEVPNAEWMLQSVSLWDVIYEHVGYWSEASMTRALLEAGFVPKSIRTGYSDQFLMVEALPAKNNQSIDLKEKSAALVKDALRFAEAAKAVLDKWDQRLKISNGKAVIWGAGSKGITFANALKASNQGLGALVDLNPRKSGLFAPGVGLEVKTPSQLPEVAPDLILIANGLYAKEIEDQVKGIGLSPSFEIITN